MYIYIYIYYIYIYTYKIYIHDVNIDASQADRALNWTARITKNIPSIALMRVFPKTTVSPPSLA